MMNILVIDDDDGDIRMVALALKQAHLDYTLSTAGTLAEGMARLRRRGIDLVLLDLGLPDSRGLETVDRVCKAYTHIPIVVLTGLSSEEAGLDAIRRGASDYLIKDKLSADVLSRAIRYSQERKKLEQRLIFLASHDPLTGALNRRAFEETVNRSIARAHRGMNSVLILFDVDHFKQINDTLGHSAGDDALVNIAQRVRDQLRAGDVLARLGGDEFAVLLEGVPMTVAHTVANRLRTSVAELGEVSGRVVHPTLSVGLVEIDGQLEYEPLISQADDCLYRAKSQGRDRLVCMNHPAGCAAPQD